MAVVTIVLALVIMFLLYYYMFRQLRRSYLINKLPGPPGLPFFGNDLSFLLPPVELWQLARQWTDEYYPIFRFWSMKWPVVNIRHPDDAEVLLSSHKHIAKSAFYDLLHPWFGTGLLTSEGQKWHMRRKILTPAFHFNVLREFVSIFDEEGRRMVQDIKDDGGNNEYDLVPLVTRYTLNAICETAMGTSLSKMTTFEHKYRRAVHDMGQFVIHRMLRPWIHPDILFDMSPTGRNQKKALDTLHGFSTKIIHERQEYHEETGGVYLKNNEALTVESSSKKRLAMLDLLIAAMKEGHIDEAGIREEVDTFIFEGHDTTGMGMCFALLLLAEHSDIQQQAREEVDAVLEKSGGKMDITDIQQLTYLDRCIKEALRLFPSVPLISRHIKEDLHLKNYVIPGGTEIHLHIYDLHRDPHFWPDPLKYDPDRFLPERASERHPYSYIPFSAGRRNCIGQKFAMFELKALIGHLLHNYYLKPIDLVADLRLMPDLVLRPTHPIRVQFVPRWGV